MAKYYALSEEHVRTLTNILSPDIISSPVMDNMEIFKSLHIKVIEDVEFEATQTIFRRKGGEARKYKPGTPLKSRLGYMEDSVLRVSQVWARYEENLQRFREKTPFSILGSNKTYNAPVSAWILLQIGKQFAGDILNNLFFGDEKKSDTGMGLYNGYWTLINTLINEGKISTAKGNLVACASIDPGPETEKGENYDAFAAWVDGWNPILRNAQHVVVYMSPQQKRLIVESYMQKFTGLQKESNGNDSFRLLNMENIELKAHAIIGKGNRMIATIPENLQFGLDQESDWNSVLMDHDQKDFNVLIFQTQSTVGARILDTSSTKFCVSDGTITQIDQLIGDYQKNTLTVTSNNEEMGKVTVSPKKDEYEEGDTITLTPAAEGGHHFVKWSDNATINPRSIVFDGFPLTLQAIFEKDAD